MPYKNPRRGRRRLRRGLRLTVLWVFLQLRCPKVSKGERREAGIQWIQPPKAVSDPEFRQTTSGAHGSANRADCLPRGKPFGAPAGAYPLHRGDGRADCGAGAGLAALWGVHTFLSVAKEKCAKESQRHGDSRGGPPRFASWASSCGSPSGCPRARGVRCRIAPCRSLCSPPTFPAGRFGLRPRPHWGHASLRDSSLRSPAGKKPFIAHF